MALVPIPVQPDAKVWSSRRVSAAVLLAVVFLLALTILPLGTAAAQAAGPPQIVAAWVTDVTSTSVSLHASVNPEGAATGYRFEYLTAAKYQANGETFAGASRAPSFSEASLGSGESPQPALQHLVSLAPATAYRYRIVATNSSSPAGGTPGLPLTFTTEEAGASFALPDNRAWELVSPVDKNGGAIQGFGGNSGGGVLQAAENGAAITYSSSASFAGGQGAPTASQYISRRVGGEAGWATENITSPTVSGAYPDTASGVPYQLFSTDLARGLLLNGRRCEGACPRSYSLRQSESGALTPLPEAAAGMRLLSASPDLRQLIFESEGNLYEWSGGGLVPISLLPPSAGAGAAFQATSADGRFTLYTEGAHLYRYDASAEAASDLTPSGGVVGVLGISADGSRVYYLTNAGLFGWQAPGTTTVLAPGEPAAFAGDYPPATGTARLSADGSHLAFLSTARLTGYDNTDQHSGQPDSEVFLYAAPAGGGGGALACVSCNPTNERPVGPSTIPGAIANGNVAEDPTATDSYKPRVLSTSGRRLFFDSADALAPQDGSAARDLYEWEAGGEGSCAKPAGCLDLISSGKSSEASSFVDASANGSDAFFLSGDSLVPRDPGSVDLYDAREGGGIPEPPQAIPCDGDACQAVPSPPEDPAPGTLVAGQPNPPVHFPKTSCKKDQIRKHGKCVKKPGDNKKSHHRKPSHRQNRRAA